MAEDEAWAGLPPAGDDDWLTEESDEPAMEKTTDVGAPADGAGIVLSDNDGIQTPAPQDSEGIFFAEEDAAQQVANAQSENWVDTLALHNTEDGDVQAGWTLQLDSDRAGPNPGADYVELSGEAQESDSLPDESSINFNNLEQIEW